MHIKQAKYLISSPSVDKCPPQDKPEYAFIGRSNVGKSSLINMLCGNEKLAKTSSTPGKTQLINHFEINAEGADEVGKLFSYSWYLVDLPGYGFAKVSQSNRRKWEQMTEHYIKERTNLIMLFVLLDARLSPQKIDLDFLTKLQKWNTAVCLVFTKSDKENQRTVSSNVKRFLSKLQESGWQYLPQHIVTSATKKVGRQKMLSLIHELNLAALH
ncbi:MAG: ribosome biogenesis GTP-binding protein YihA/YsxC [Ferruginibacter sp.]|nr:ribosome biogenesis GTP-binding protein YihA/YsxC [Ferruginibacter sp.]